MSKSKPPASLTLAPGVFVCLTNACDCHYARLAICAAAIKTIVPQAVLADIAGDALYVLRSFGGQRASVAHGHIA